ncbi:MAG: sulfotransferase domain-containing protein [Chlamydiota bacterium]
MKTFTLIFSLFFSLFVYSEESHKVVYLISPPRSLSVGFLRMIEARGDFKIFHEPTIPVYHKINNLSFSHDWFRKGVFQSFDEIKEAIFKADSHVFVKEMSFSFKNLIDEDLMTKPNVYFVFLLRNPHHTIISLYNKIGSIVEDFHEAVGYESTYEIFQTIQKYSTKKPLILFSEELASAPESTVKMFCDYVGIPFKEESLIWKNLGENFNGHQEWNESKRGELTQHWHKEAIQSTQFNPLKTYEVDNLGSPTFSEVKDLKDLEECKKAYAHHLPFYLFFRETSFENTSCDALP